MGKARDFINDPVGFTKKVVKLVKWLPKWIPDNYSAYIVLRRRLENWVMQVMTSEDFETVNFNEEDWDNLIILDACRFDIMQKYNPFDTDVGFVYSNASHTHEFLEKNFADQYLDTVYVTSSPQVAQFGGEFAHVEHVWKECWNDEHNTVMPEDVVEAALEIAEKYPDKRLIVHFMQPHFPFIDSEIEQGSFRGSDQGRKLPSVWEKMYAGEVDKDIVKQDYEHNLELALPEVERLIDNLKGKTVVSADHGNLFGKKLTSLPIKTYGHPVHVKDEELNKVPWIELPFEERKEIVSADKNEGEEEEIDEEEVREKLADLGYGN
jgi:hypothetical protein